MRHDHPRKTTDFCDKHWAPIRDDAGEAHADGRVRKANLTYASVLALDELFADPAFIEELGFDPRHVAPSGEALAILNETLLRFSPVCCYLTEEARERVLRKSRDPPIELERLEAAIRADRAEHEAPPDHPSSPAIPAGWQNT